MTALTALSEDAVYEICRALADRGTDYGFDVYGSGSNAPSAAKRRQMLADDDSAQGWLDAFDAALALHKSTTGKAWSY